MHLVMFIQVKNRNSKLNSEEIKEEKDIKLIGSDALLVEPDLNPMFKDQLNFHIVEKQYANTFKKLVRSVWAYSYFLIRVTFYI